MSLRQLGVLLASSVSPLRLSAGGCRFCGWCAGRAVGQRAVRSPPWPGRPRRCDRGRTHRLLAGSAATYAGAATATPGSPRRCRLVRRGGRRPSPPALCAPAVHPRASALKPGRAPSAAPAAAWRRTPTSRCRPRSHEQREREVLERPDAEQAGSDEQDAGDRQQRGDRGVDRPHQRLVHGEVRRLGVGRARTRQRVPRCSRAPCRRPRPCRTASSRGSSGCR